MSSKIDIPNELFNQLDIVISNKLIKTVFQPILSLVDGSTLGYEALSRLSIPADSPDLATLSMDRLFSLANEAARLWDLEYLTRTIAIESASAVLENLEFITLFINVNPVIFHDSRFRKGFTKERLLRFGIDAENVIIEISEKNAIVDIEGFRFLLDHYKNQHFKIAMDDVGAGYAGLNAIADIAPHYVKLDMNLIRDIHKNRLKYALVKGVVEFSKASHVQIIAEGIETNDELETLIAIGVQYGQGFLLGKPAEAPPPTDIAVLETIRQLNAQRNHMIHRTISDIYVKNIAMPVEVVSPDEKIVTLYANHICNPEWIGACVVKNKKPVGIVTRESLIAELNGHFRSDIHRNKSVAEIMDRDFLSVDEKAAIADVSIMAMARAEDRLYDFIEITRQENHLGVVTIRKLLQKTTELETASARH